jgi:hypothetical protein
MPKALVSRDYFLKGSIIGSIIGMRVAISIQSIIVAFLLDVGTFKVFISLPNHALYPCVWNGHYQNKIEV